MDVQHRLALRSRGDTSAAHVFLSGITSSNEARGRSELGALDHDFLQLVDDLVEGRSLARIRRPALRLEFLERRGRGLVGRPGEGLALDLGEDGVVVELLEGQLALVEHLPDEAGVRVDVTLRRVLVLEHCLLGHPSQGDHLVLVLRVLLVVGFLRHAGQGHLDGQAAGDDAVAGGDVLVDEAVVGYVLQSSCGLRVI